MALVTWQTGLLGVRVGEAKEPGPPKSKRTEEERRIGNRMGKRLKHQTRT